VTVRTTLDIDDAVHEAARLRAFQERRSLGDVISELASIGLTVVQRERQPRRIGMYDGQLEIADDFDATPDDVIEATERPLSA
jgi:hypothetical protein